MIGHTVVEGFVLLRQRAIVSTVLALTLAAPIALAGSVLTVGHWLEPLVASADLQRAVTVLLHPNMDASQRAQWLEPPMCWPDKASGTWRRPRSRSPEP